MIFFTANFFAIGLGMPELLIVLVLLLLLFGGSRLPQLAKGLGSSLKEFKKGVADGDTEDELEAARRRERLAADDLEAARRERLRGQG